MENMNQEEVVLETPATAEVPEAPETPAAPEVPANGGAKALKKAKPFLDKVKSLPKKVWIAVAAAVVVLVGAIVLIGALNNTPTTPIKLMVNAMNNKKTPKSLDYNVKLLNGFLEDEVKEIYKVLAKTDLGEELLEYVQESFEENVEYYQEQYGDNYKGSFKVENKEKLEKSDLREMRDYFKEAAESLEEMIEETEDWDSDDWEDAADEVGMTKSQMKSFVKALEKLAKAMKKVDVTDGYELDVVYKITGSELDEPEEQEDTVYVFKVNGRWISLESIGAALQAISYSF